RSGTAVVRTAEEIIGIVEERGADAAAAAVDVVTTGTFGAMCSSGVFLNLGHTRPKMKISRAWINDVEAYSGIAAVDVYLGAAQVATNDPLNMVFPGEFRYGGGHVIQDLVAGKSVRLAAEAYGTDCYPRKHLETSISLAEINEATLFNPRNCYQNYNVAVNAGAGRTIYTYLGVLKPHCGNANYSSAGQLSPLLNDPFLRTIGIGTRIFLGGGVGYIAWQGTQHNPGAPRDEGGIPTEGAATLSLIGDLKQMNPRWLVGLSLLGYGVSLMVGVGVPIPLLDGEVAHRTAVRDRDILAPIVDYSSDYPERSPRILGRVSYEELRSGSIGIEGKRVPTVPLSSYAGAREIASLLKSWIEKGTFSLTEPAARLPGPESAVTLKPLEIRRRDI
ncbi:MAG TPA: homocysteine biosynthesis protein, partial [bacterium]|nr:homocysteine biosynthesis protein [bacterium]